MTPEFYTSLKARLAELVAPLRCLHQPTGTVVAPQVIDVMLPRATAATETGEEYPFVRWMVTRGVFEVHGRVSFTLVLDAGIYTDDTVASGNEEITALALALGRIVERPVFTPYRIDGEVRFTIGHPGGEASVDSESPGLQPHPYYHCRLHVPFMMMAPSRRTV